MARQREHRYKAYEAISTVSGRAKVAPEGAPLALPTPRSQPAMSGRRQGTGLPGSSRITLQPEVTREKRPRSPFSMCKPQSFSASFSIKR